MHENMKYHGWVARCEQTLQASQCQKLSNLHAKEMNSRLFVFTFFNDREMEQVEWGLEMSLLLCLGK